ncbi:MAG TPA: serine hydrolase domain-containing protein, partial [Chitinophagaceae bacterium]|nr:serine hydrolase domain-containing protein [Chitinophagaceae bacterium]
MKHIILIIFLFVSVFACAQRQDTIDRLINRKMVEQKLVGLSIGIIKDGKLLKSSGYGLANLEYRVLADENTVYKLASISKHMIAVAIMKLKEDGRLNLSDRVTRYFPDAPDSWNNITIRHLLNHTSGLTGESPGFRFNLAQSDSTLIREAYKVQLNFPTGTKWEYCNLGYFMLADIIRKITGVPFAQYMEREIFSKYGMSRTATTAVFDVNPFKAEGYLPKGKDSMVKAEAQIALRPSGAFVSNVTDMMKWEMLIQSEKIISRQSWQQMWSDTVQSTRKDPAGGNVFYGYGLQVTKFNEQT